MTAAHKTLPFGSEVKVTNLNNGKSVTVRINDRGPFVKGRIIDLSRAAFSQIANLDRGVVKVEIRVVK
jgi:rare lipoprotein A